MKLIELLAVPEPANLPTMYRHESNTASAAISELRFSECGPQTATGRKAAAKATAQAGSCLTGTAEGNGELDGT